MTLLCVCLWMEWNCVLCIVKLMQQRWRRLRFSLPNFCRNIKCFYILCVFASHRKREILHRHRHTAEVKYNEVYCVRLNWSSWIFFVDLFFLQLFLETKMISILHTHSVSSVVVALCLLFHSFSFQRQSSFSLSMRFWMVFLSLVFSALFARFLVDLEFCVRWYAFALVKFLLFLSDAINRNVEHRWDYVPRDSTGDERKIRFRNPLEKICIATSNRTKGRNRRKHWRRRISGKIEREECDDDERSERWMRD